ncbi:MAG: Coenzyme F420 hydrogenase/dehydrogenase, beta subunit C-terminal domain [Eubacterium sp.]
MINIQERPDCCGCTACYNICPVNAINMTPDTEGFLYPAVNMDKCIDCRLCEKVCPIACRKSDNGSKVEMAMPKGYIVRFYNDDIVRDSTSGGMFTAIAEYCLEKGAVVYGAGYDDNMNVVCQKAVTIEEVSKMRGSKFVQTRLGDTFKEIKKLLESGSKVLFTGTPCQVSGLLAYLGRKPQNLICVDFACRGVPSPMLWENYISMMENKYNSKIIGAKFKNKTYGYHATTMKIDFDNGKTWYGSGRIDPMMKAFVSELASRPSCGECYFKGIKRQSDITMFDCYEFEAITHEKDDNKGYSSIFINSETGKIVFDKIRTRLKVWEVDIDKLISKNGVMVNYSAKPNARREEFYKYIKEYPIDVAMNKVSAITYKDILIERTKGIMSKLGLIRLVKKLKRQRVRINENSYQEK